MRGESIRDAVNPNYIKPSQQRKTENTITRLLLEDCRDKSRRLLSCCCLQLCLTTHTSCDFSAIFDTILLDR